MTFPRMTPLSRPLMTSKIRLLVYGTGDVYLKCHFPQLSSTSLALLGPLKSYREIQTTYFKPNLILVRRALIGSLPQFNYLKKSDRSSEQYVENFVPRKKN